MKTFQWKQAAAAFALICTPICAQAAINYTEWTEPGAVSFSGNYVPPSEEQVLGYVTDAVYTWYCDPAFGLSCSGTNSAPNMVEFRNEFYLPDFHNGIPLTLSHAFIDIAADDYFALYANGNLLTPDGVWLDDTGDHASHYDLMSSLVLGANNEILIFACDGYPTGAEPGASPAGGWNGCQPEDRVNNWLLTDGWIRLIYNELGGEHVDTIYLGSNPNHFPETFWEVRGATVPEPGAVSLMLVGALGWLLVQGKRKRHAQK